MDEKSKLILKHYTLDTLNILDQSVKLFEDGHTSFYRVAAAQLRILLCDTTFRHDHQEDIAVVPILAPDIQLLLLDDQGNPRQGSSPVAFNTWLDAPAGSFTNLTVRQLIRRVCDIDGGVHIDIKPNAGLPENGNTRQWIINVGKYLYPVLLKAIQ